MATIFLIQLSFSAEFRTSCHFSLDFEEQLLRYYRGMIVFDIVLWQVVDVLYSFLLQRINCDGFLEQRISYVLLVGKDFLYSCSVPFCFPVPGFNTIMLESFCDADGASASRYWR